MSEPIRSNLILNFDGSVKLEDAFQFYREAFGAISKAKQHRHRHSPGDPLHMRMLDQDIFLERGSDPRGIGVGVTTYTTHGTDLDQLMTNAVNAGALKASYVNSENWREVEVEDPYGFHWRIIRLDQQPPGAVHQDGWVQLPRLKFLLVTLALRGLFHSRGGVAKGYEVVKKMAFRHFFRF